MRRVWNLLPLGIRASIAIAAITASFIPVSTLPPLWLLASVVVCAAALWSLGAFEFRRAHRLIVLSSALCVVWIAIFASAFGRPTHEFEKFILHYPQILCFLLGVTVLTSGLRLSEGISSIKHIPILGAVVAPLVVAVSTAWSTPAVMKNLEARRVAHPREWFERRSASRIHRWTIQIVLRSRDALLDRSELLVTLIVAMGLELGAALTRWRSISASAPVLSVNGRHRPTLNAVYSMIGFARFYDDVFGRRPVATKWCEVLSRCVRPGSSVLDIGAGTGRVSQLLASLGAYVDAVEENIDLAGCFRKQVFAGNHENVSLLIGVFPRIVNDRTYDVVVLHQNVMIELINEYGVEATWDALARVTRPGGTVVFDYPVNTTTPLTNSRVALLDRQIDGLGKVRYGYQYLGQDTGRHLVNLSLDIQTKEQLSTSQSLPIYVTIPSATELEQAAQRLGFRVTESAIFQGHTFFPSELSIYVVQQCRGRERV